MLDRRERNIRVITLRSWEGMYLLIINRKGWRKKEAYSNKLDQRKEASNSKWGRVH